jgi:hypothetical protein
MEAVELFARWLQLCQLTADVHEAHHKTIRFPAHHNKHMVSQSTGRIPETVLLHHLRIRISVQSLDTHSAIMGWRKKKMNVCKPKTPSR